GRRVGADGAGGGRLVRLARDVGLEARVGIANGRTAARVASHGDARVTIVPAGADAASLAPAPLDRLDLPEAVVTTLRRWGIADLGALAALPRDALATRLGPDGLRAHDLASSGESAPFHPWTPPRLWEEAQGVDWEVHDLLALGAVLEVVLARLVARLSAVHLAADVIDVRLGLVSGAHHERTVALAHPTRDVDVMLALLRLDLERRPLPAAVIDVALSVRPVVARPGQGGLWQPPGRGSRRPWPSATWPTCSPGSCVSWGPTTSARPRSMILTGPTRSRSTLSHPRTARSTTPTRRPNDLWRSGACARLPW